jgi:hypothetical protein
MRMHWTVQASTRQRCCCAEPWQKLGLGWEQAPLAAACLSQTSDHHSTSFWSSLWPQSPLTRPGAHSAATSIRATAAALLDRKALFR